MDLAKDFSRTCVLVQGGRIKKILGCFRTPGVHAVTIYRFGYWLRNKNMLINIFLKPIYLFLHRRIIIKFGIDVMPSAKIGPGFYIGHFGGIIVGGEVQIGCNVSISQGVTIGVSGRGKKRGSPTIGDNVYIGPGAKIFGQIKIGSNVSIGANSVIYKDIPDNTTVVLSPGFKIISRNNEM